MKQPAWSEWTWAVIGAHPAYTVWYFWLGMTGKYSVGDFLGGSMPHVDWIPWCCWSRCPFEVATKFGRCLRNALAVSPGNVARKTLPMTEKRVRVVGLNSSTWRKVIWSGSVLWGSRLLILDWLGCMRVNLKLGKEKVWTISHFGLAGKGVCLGWLALGIMRLVLPHPFLGCKRSFSKYGYLPGSKNIFTD